MAERELSLKLTEEAKDLLVEKGWDPAMGARPLRRAIQRYIEDPLADWCSRRDGARLDGRGRARRPEGEEPEVSIDIVGPVKGRKRQAGGVGAKGAEGEGEGEGDGDSGRARARARPARGSRGAARGSGHTARRRAEPHRTTSNPGGWRAGGRMPASASIPVRPSVNACRAGRFFEPADTRIASFDNSSDSEPATFVAFYLLPSGEERLIVMAE